MRKNMSHRMSYWLWCELRESPARALWKNTRRSHTKSLKSSIDRLPPLDPWSQLRSCRVWSGSLRQIKGGACAHAADFVWERTVWNNVRGKLRCGASLHRWRNRTSVLKFFPSSGAVSLFFSNFIFPSVASWPCQKWKWLAQSTAMQQTELF